MTCSSTRLASIITPFSSSIITLLLVITTTLFFLFTPLHCLNSMQPRDTLKVFMAEEKTRLGSTPPTCHNKCNQCHPCIAAQVPTITSHDRFSAGSVKGKQLDYSGSIGNGRYSNYKPLGWKCRCGSHFYNP